METETQKIIKQRVVGAPVLLKQFLASDDWTNILKKIYEKFNLNEQKFFSLQNEVVLVLLGIKNTKEFESSLKTELEIDSNIAGWIAEDVEKNIFSKVSKEIAEMWQAGERETSSFENEDSILRMQAMAMQPVLDPEEKNFEPRTGQIPNNLPIDNSIKILNQNERGSRNIHNYKPGSDPYREPVE